MLFSLSKVDKEGNIISTLKKISTVKSEEEDIENEKENEDFKQECGFVFYKMLT